MKANYEDKIPKKTSEVALGNLYDMNKQLMEKEIALTDNEIMNTETALKNWLIELFAQKYFMLLCHERRDYTLFNLDKTNSWKIPQDKMVMDAAFDIIECLTNRGTLLSAELQPDGVWEFWIKDLVEGCFAYYLFPYGEAVLEY